jgi:hypothetical protein
MLGFYHSKNPENILTALPLLMLTILFGALLSIPALFLFWLLYKDVRHGSLNELVKKIVLSFIGISLVWISFILIDRSFFANLKIDTLTWPISYSICIITGCFIFNLEYIQLEDH